MEGRIYSVAFAPDGVSFAACSSLDGKGEVNIYNYDFDTVMPAAILAIEGKAGRSDADKKTLDEHYTNDVKLLAAAKFDVAIYAVSYKPDGSLLAAAGEDGRIRLMNPKDAKVVKEFTPVTVSATAASGR